MYVMDLEKCLTHQWSIHVICCRLNKQTNSSMMCFTEEELMDNLFKEVCGMFRDPTRNVRHSWTINSRESLLHLSLKGKERN